MVLAASTLKPSFGYDNQSYRWVTTGKPVDPNLSYQAGYFNIQTESVSYFQNTIWEVPGINTDPFGMYPPAPDRPYPQDPKPVMNQCDIVIDPPPLPPPKKDDDDRPPSGIHIAILCKQWKKWVPDDDPPDDIFPPPPENPVDPAICSTQPPSLKMPPIDSLETFSWSNMKNQWITFRNDSQPNYDLSKIQIGSQNWLTNFQKPNSNGRIATCGNMDISYTPDPGNIFSDKPELISNNQFRPNSVVSMPPEDRGHWYYGNTIDGLILYFPHYCMEQPSGDLCINCDPVGTPPRQPNDNDSYEAYDTKLPYPEIVQSNNIGTGNEESPLDKDIFAGPGYIANPMNGAIEHKYVDFSIPIHGNLNLEFSRSYSSIMGNVGNILGFGWSTNIDERVLYLNDGYISYQCSSGENYIFTPNRNENSVIISYASPPQLDAKTTLIVNGEQTYVKIDDKDGFISKVFDSKGLIKYIRSQFGGEIEVIRNAQGQVTQLKDNYSGRYLEFTYDTYGRLVSVLAPENRNWTYAYNVNGLLSTATNPISGTWNYEYSDNKLSKITNPRGNDTYFTYDTNNKISNVQQEGSTNSTNIYYSSSDYHSTKMVKPTGETLYEVFSQDSQLAGIIDGNGKHAIIEYNMLRMEKPVTLFNQIGDFVAANLYNQNGDVLKQFDADGNYKEYTYTTNGKIASYKDRVGKKHQ